MRAPNANWPENVYSALWRLKRNRAAPQEEYCELCGAAIAAAHRHLWRVSNRRTACACDACAMRFANVVDGHFKLIPRDPESIPGFQMSDAQWESLALPINLTFFYHDSAAGKMTAMYPSPAGATESLLPMAKWEALAEENPRLALIKPDVEALLVNRLVNTREYFIAPIDVCYELAGLVRAHWRGLSGGEKVWDEVEGFFGRLRARADCSTAEVRGA